MSIQVRNIHKRFGSFVALDDVSLDFPTGELVALLGPSGCGKTTLLRVIAGLEQADAGQVLLDGEDASGTHVRDRQVGFVFQHYALFRHMSVFDNVAFGLRMKPRGQRPTEKQIAEKVHALLDLVQLDWLADRFPAQLSGGQRQRIAIARALALQPRLVICDEPTSALDVSVQAQILNLQRELQRELSLSCLFITHNIGVVEYIADEVAVMRAGRLVEQGAADQMLGSPAHDYTRTLLAAVPRLTGAAAG
ncbi:MAG: ATP-binding cassette domain-containing protein [Rubrivivax sp.]|nr:ATP-binding cassette domain-containing protein [Rubrivivax sp.]